LEAGRSKRVKNNSTEKKQKAQFSISWRIGGFHVSICSYLRSSANINKKQIANHYWEVDSNFRWIK
jgi:hypothetical protein